MTIQIELGQEMKEVLESRARLQGLPVGDYALQVLQQALESQPKSEERKRATQEEFRAFLDAMAISTEGTRLLAHENYDREFIYGDHP